jgi:hypothetical protein
MEVIFLIPFRSSKTTSNWDAVCKNLSYTVQSIQNQSNTNYRIVIISNEKPAYIQENERLIILHKEYPLPQSYEEMLLDIRLKIFDGMVYAKQLAPCYIIRLDGDDLVRQDFVDKVLESKGRGFYFYLGYDYSVASRRLMVRPRFFMHCGSAHVIFLNSSDFPGTGDTYNSGKWFMNIWNHQSIDKLYFSYFRKRLPVYPGIPVIRLINTGENIQFNSENFFIGIKSIIWRLFFFRKMNSTIIKQFSIPKEYVS